jgi:hypothetical protein
MRYYNIVLANPTTGEQILPSSLGAKRGTNILAPNLSGQDITSLLPNGQPNPGALNIELDISESPRHIPVGESYLRIWGLGLQDIGATLDLNGVNISMFAGMSKGLPLANPAQSGLIVKGSVFNSWGNWIGTDQTIDLVLGPPTGN